MQDNLKHYELITLLAIIILSISTIILITEPNIVGLVTKAVSTSTTILNAPPYPVQLISPEDEEPVNTVEILLEWNTTTDPNGEPVISYWLRLSNQSDYNNTIINDSNITGTEYFLNATSLNLSKTSYYWQVLAYDGDDYSADNTRMLWYCIFNQKPSISEIENQTIYVYDRLVLQLNASDPDNETLTFVVSSTITVSEDGLINTTLSTGTFLIIVVVIDECGETDSTSFNLTVKKTAAPITSSGGGRRTIIEYVSVPEEVNITNVTIEEVEVEEIIIPEIIYLGNLDITPEITTLVEKEKRYLFTHNRINRTLYLLKVYEDTYFLWLKNKTGVLLKKGKKKETDITEDGVTDVVFKLENIAPLIISIKKVEKKEIVKEEIPMKTDKKFVWGYLIEGLIILVLASIIIIERRTRKRKFAIAKSEHYFILKGGGEIKSIKELLEAIKDMSDETYFAHVRKGKNDFAAWIRDVFHNKKLAEHIEEAKTRLETISILEDFFK